MCEEYNGWKNRETWALNLWLSNDQGLYEMTRERVAARLEFDENVSAYDTDPWQAENKAILQAYQAGEAVKELWEELTDPEGDFAPLPVETIRMIADVGSDYRVDWDEIGAHWLADVTESPVES